MTKVLQIEAPGGPDAFKLTDIEIARPDAEEIVVAQDAIGINYIDVYHRNGAYPVPLPAIPGLEGAGRVEAVGSNVKEFAIGDRIAYAGGPLGGYAAKRLLPSRWAVKLPEEVSSDTAAAILFKGITAQYLLKSTANVASGQTILLYAPVGGLGQIMAPWAKQLGARVIGVTSSDEKEARALEKGCDAVVRSDRGNIAKQVEELTGGEKVNTVFDSVGAQTLTASLDSLKPRGMLVSFGIASGPTPPLDLAELGKRGSLFVTRPTIVTHIGDVEEYRQRADDVFSALQDGIITANVGRTYSLAEGGKAHADLESRTTTGSLILKPDAPA